LVPILSKQYVSQPIILITNFYPLVELISTLKNNTNSDNAENLLKTFVETSEIVEKSLKKNDDKEGEEEPEANEESKVYALSFDEQLQLLL